MILIILVILGLAIGIIMVCTSDDLFDDLKITIGLYLSAICFIFLAIMVIILILKPKNYKEFKIKYDTVKETLTYKDDIRDAGYINNIIEINNSIKYCREFKDSVFIGIFQNDKICQLDLIKKEGEDYGL